MSNSASIHTSRAKAKGILSSMSSTETGAAASLLQADSEQAARQLVTGLSNETLAKIVCAFKLWNGPLAA
jgi:hypothetical protein